MNVKIDERRLDCLQTHKNIKYLRKHTKETSKFDQFRLEHIEIIDEHIKLANQILMKRFGKSLPLKEYTYMKKDKKDATFIRGQLES